MNHLTPTCYFSSEKDIYLWTPKTSGISSLQLASGAKVNTTPEAQRWSDNITGNLKSVTIISNDCGDTIISNGYEVTLLLGTWKWSDTIIISNDCKVTLETWMESITITANDCKMTLLLEHLVAWWLMCLSPWQWKLDVRSLYLGSSIPLSECDTCLQS